ncbi:unnamed protein product [Paramecium sonneborni]|uniref:ABC transporter family protein n=1 Tax=Paramecium sonneborni TaxID=65129 RepID=A0A8S1JX23_9CILI|nr:unnamed protein product [Paramecium sonneborni]
MNQDVIEKNDEDEQKIEDQSIFNINMNVEIKKGQFVAFVGNSASGKSTILRSILGETEKQQGNIIVNGTISVATQEPWIISGSIKKNITFMNSFDSVKYKQIIKICGLERDIASFKNGDDTILGEKGDNLSGGQQKRINLARAIYNDADIYLLDDPTSALDIKVKYSIHQQCFSQYLKNKTRILFTNSLSNLQECDIIYIISNGQIIQQGKFHQILGQNLNQQYQQKEDLKPSATSMLLFVIIQLIYKLILSLLKPYQSFYICLLSVKLQGALSQEILLKTLKFPILRSKHYSTGELINMMQVDIHQASNYFYYAIILFTVPLQLLIAFIVVFLTLKSQAVIPAIGSVIQAVIGILFGVFYGILQKRYMVAKDNRMKAVDEALNYAKQVKLNTFEEFFEQRIRSYREKELQQLKNEVYMMIFLPLIQSIFAILTWEAVFFLTNPINFTTINIMMSNYSNISNILSNLPYQYKSFQVSRNSMARLDNYFKQNECNKIERLSENVNFAIKINNGIYSWKSNDKMNQDVIEKNDEDEQKIEDQSIFNINMNVEIKKGQFVAFVGNSASGKSTILRSILGETEKQQGNIIVNGTISVATQEPWIISGSIKKNITFMNSFDSVKYKQIIKICGLERDIASFKNGDDTILGEKGDNLSGGQQKRINLARAIYNDADIYLLDDPTSALDIKVKYSIHQQCFSQYLKNKTRILFTNSLSNLQECDIIYIISNGQIIQQGKFHQILGQNLNQQYQQKEVIDFQFEDKHYKQESPENQDIRSSLIQTEDQEKGAISNSVLKQVFIYLGKYVAPLCNVLYFITVLGFQLIGNKYMAQTNISDEEYRQLALVYFPLIQSPILIAIILLCTYYLIMGLSTSRKIHNSVIHSLLNASYTKFYNTILIGRLMNRLSKDIYNIDLLFPNEIQNLTIQITTLLLPLFACFLYLNIVAMPFLIIFFIILIYITVIYYRCLREITRIEAVSKSPVFSFFQQIVRGIIYVRTCLPTEKVVIQQQRNVDIDLGNQINLYGFQYWYQQLAGSITNIFQALLFVICFIFPGQTQEMTIMVLTQMQAVSQLLLNASISYGNIQMYLISFERCLHLANNIEKEERSISLITPTGDETDNSMEKQKKEMDDKSVKQENENAESNIVLKLDNCTFQYRSNSKCVLQQLSLQLQKKEKIGVVGRTGAGKSSIILALTAILEQIEGSMEIEKKNINHYSINELRQKFGIIPQDPLIFMGTLKQNLDPLNKYEEFYIQDIVQQCGLLEMQSFKQQGLKSEIGLSGSNLSLGEKQLLNIVRCILENKNIVLVDEATSNIDSQTEEQVKNLFEKYFSNVAMISIAHKVTTIMNSDRIMVLNDGKITEFDHPQKLLADPNSEFKKIIDLIKHSEEL